MTLLSKPRAPGWIVCIDFGTALSKVAMVRDKNRTLLEPDDIRPLKLTDGGRNPYLLPSIVFVTDRRLLFGQEALDLALRSEDRHALVSPKQYLSTHDPEDFDQRLPPEIDPSGRFSAKGLLRLYLAHLLERAGQDARQRDLPWPVPVRLARPAWQAERAVYGEKTLKMLVRDGFALVDKLGSALSAKGGLTHGAAQSAVAGLTGMTAAEEKRIFKLSNKGEASVLEATAAAMGTIRNSGRRIVAVADIGAGTSDFGAFMTGLPGKDVLAEIEGSSQVLREAGDFLDMQLRRHILEKAGLLLDDPAARGDANRLRVRARNNKETLFSEGLLTVQVGDDIIDVTMREFLADQYVKGFARRLRDKFHATLNVAVSCAQMYSPPSDQTPVEILLTGGGHALPMVRALFETPSIPWLYCEAAPDLAERPEDISFFPVARQLVVAIGGAVRELPVMTAPVRGVELSS